MRRSCHKYEPFICKVKLLKWENQSEGVKEQSDAAETGADKRMHPGYKLVFAFVFFLHDFLADVKDWMFQHIQLNLDKTGIIQAEEMLE